LNHIEEKLTRARLAFSILSNIQSFNAMKVADGVLVAPFPPHFNATPRPVEGLLSNEQIIQVLAEKEQYSLELAYLAERLKALTPHLLP